MLDFDCPDSQGSPVYCDSSGELRTVPPSTATRYSLDDNVAPDRNLGAGDDWYSPTTTTFTNPSPCRDMVFFCTVRAEFTAALNANTTVRFRAGSPNANTGSGAGLDMFRITSPNAQTITFAGPVNGAIIVPAASAQVFNTGMTTQCLSGGLNVVRHRYTVHAVGFTI
jgi:hypothetical protein